MANRPDTVAFDTTIAALQHDLTAIPADDAYAMIDAWQRQLQSTKDHGFNNSEFLRRMG
jgi:hypothetical protein